MPEETPPPSAPPPFANRRAIDTPQFQEVQQKVAKVEVRQAQQGERVSYFGEELKKVWGALLFLFLVGAAGFTFALWITSFAPRAELKEQKVRLDDALLGTPTTDGILTELRKARKELDDHERRLKELEHPPTKRR